MALRSISLLHLLRFCICAFADCLLPCQVHNECVPTQKGRAASPCLAIRPCLETSRILGTNRTEKQAHCAEVTVYVHALSRLVCLFSLCRRWKLPVGESEFATIHGNYFSPRLGTRAAGRRLAIRLPLLVYSGSVFQPSMEEIATSLLGLFLPQMNSSD